MAFDDLYIYPVSVVLTQKIGGESIMSKMAWGH